MQFVRRVLRHTAACGALCDVTADGGVALCYWCRYTDNGICFETAREAYVSRTCGSRSFDLGRYMKCRAALYLIRSALGLCEKHAPY